MLACTRSSQKSLQKKFHKEIRRAMQPLHLLMIKTFCVTHTFPLFIARLLVSDFLCTLGVSDLKRSSACFIMTRNLASIQSASQQVAVACHI